MHAVIVWWDLRDSAQTVESLRAYLRDEAVTRFSAVSGLLFKLWIADPETDRWGAVMVWESPHAADQPLPARAAELIGYGPTQRLTFQVEATTEIIHRLLGTSSGLE